MQRQIGDPNCVVQGIAPDQKSVDLFKEEGKLLVIYGLLGIHLTSEPVNGICKTYLLCQRLRPAVKFLT